MTDLHVILSLLPPVWEADGGRLREQRQPQDAASVAAWGSLGVQHWWPLVLSAISSPFQNHFRMVKWRRRWWPGRGEKLGKKQRILPPRFAGCLHTISMHCFHFRGNYLKLFSLKAKKTPPKTKTHMGVCVYAHTYTVSILGFHLT